MGSIYNLIFCSRIRVCTVGTNIKFTFRIRRTNVVRYGFHSFHSRPVFLVITCLCTSVYVLNAFERGARISGKATFRMVFSSYKRQRILFHYLQGTKAPTIAKFLQEEKLKASRVGIAKFSRKFEETWLY